MWITRFIPLVVLIASSVARGESIDEAIQNCPDFQTYSVFPYIRAGIMLQSMGRDSAISVLKRCCETDGNNNRVIILCRMLFESNESARRPLIGAAVFPGGTTYSHWPLEPIEIVRNIPFLVVRGYLLGGLPEPAIDYLEYCELHCEWRDDCYRIPSDSELEVALDELLNSDRWQIPLADEEEQFFRSQTITDKEKL